MKRIAFLRHGHTDLNCGDEPRIRGFLDVSLNETGRRAVASSAEYLREEKIRIQAIESSPLGRCTETAEILRDVCCPHAEITINEDITEVNWGTWEGLTYEEAMGTSSYESILPHHMNPPGGENLFAVSERCACFVRDFLAGPLDTVAAVSHGSVISIMLCGMLEIPINKYWTTYLSNAKAGIVAWDGHMWSLERWGAPAKD